MRKLGMVAYTCYPSTWEAKGTKMVGGHLGYIARLCLKKLKKQRRAGGERSNCIVTLSIFLSFILMFSASVISFSLSHKVGLLETNSLSFTLAENILIVIPERHYWVRV
jgi:hypothetical protein